MTSRWIIGARPRTLPASAVPVVVGTGIAAANGGVIWWRAAVALVVSVAIQVGTNYANDYSDGVRGTDATRVGPLRLVASGLAPARLVRLAAFVSFLVAGLAGIALAAVAGWWLIGVGAACFAAGWLYTGGPKPYGYAGLGEPFVFVFFGLVATGGTAYVQTETLTALLAFGSAAVGLLAVAILVVNNLRDIDGDRRAGKRTLAVMMGGHNTRRLYVICLLLPFALAFLMSMSRQWALLALAALPLTFVPSGRVLRGASGPELIDVLFATGLVQLFFGLLLALGVAVS